MNMLVALFIYEYVVVRLLLSPPPPHRLWETWVDSKLYCMLGRNLVECWFKQALSPSVTVWHLLLLLSHWAANHKPGLVGRHHQGDVFHHWQRCFFVFFLLFFCGCESVINIPAQALFFFCFVVFVVFVVVVNGKTIEDALGLQSVSR